MKKFKRAHEVIEIRYFVELFEPIPATLIEIETVPSATHPVRTVEQVRVCREL